jgi:hypothetical protein
MWFETKRPNIIFIQRSHIQTLFCLVFLLVLNEIRRLLKLECQILHTILGTVYLYLRQLCKVNSMKKHANFVGQVRL